MSSDFYKLMSDERVEWKKLTTRDFEWLCRYAFTFPRWDYFRAAVTEVGGDAGVDVDAMIEWSANYLARIIGGSKEMQRDAVSYLCFAAKLKYKYDQQLEDRVIKLLAEKCAALTTASCTNSTVPSPDSSTTDCPQNL